MAKVAFSAPMHANSSSNFVNIANRIVTHFETLDSNLTSGPASKRINIIGEIDDDVVCDIPAAKVRPTNTSLT